MASKGRSSSRKRIAISFVIRDVEEKFNRAGVNAVRMDPTNQVLYTAGRDSIIRMWDIQDSDRGKVEVSGQSKASLSDQAGGVSSVVVLCSTRSPWSITLTGLMT